MLDLPSPVAVVLGGGGRLGAAQVGMLEALDAAGVTPDLVVGTSIGAINGAAVAAWPHGEGTTRLRELWRRVEEEALFADGVLYRLRTAWRTGVSLHSTEELASPLTDVFGDRTIEGLPTPFACVAACIETASAEWFDSGPLVRALLASSAVPGLFEPTELDGRHYLDGGLVDSIPLSRAVEAGAQTVFVLQVGRIEHPLQPPRNPLQVAQVAFEIARRHRFSTLMRNLPEGVDVHVLPSGGTAPQPTDLLANLRYADISGVTAAIAAAREATAAYLAAVEVA